MKRSLAATAAVVLAVLAAGCDDGDEKTSPTPSAGTSSEASADEPGAGEVENETYPRGAELPRFCAVIGEIDAAIDEAEPGKDEDWDRILSAFEALDALGVPDDLSEAAVSELAQLEISVQQVGSVQELMDAAQPPLDTVTAYVADHCG